ncbi:MAG: hypothetical protein QM790_05590 [Nibricoccus sp.]
MKHELVPKSSKVRCFAFLLGIAAVFCALACRQHQFVNRYAVNMMFMDQWSIYRPLFEEQSGWAGFTLQHGPHRQGVGFAVIELLAKAGAWDSRWDAFSVSWTLIAAAVVALVLFRKFGARSLVAFLAVPLLYFNIRQWEQFAGASNISHGAMPMLLVTLYALVWLIEKRPLRWLLLAVLSFCAIFTGFALYVGVISLGLLALESRTLFKGGQKRDAWLCVSALVFVLCSWALFFQGYRFGAQETVPVGIPSKATNVAHFALVMLANAHGVSGVGIVATSVGFIITLAMLAMVVYHGFALMKEGPARQPQRAVIFCFAAFVLLYCATAAWGRAPEGIQAARASRYVTLLIPAGLAVVLQLSLLGDRWLYRLVQAGYVVFLAVFTLQLRPADLKQAEAFRTFREEWKRLYLASHDASGTDAALGEQIFPGGGIGPQLRYLEDHKLNLFKEPGK